jgi:F-type H+-transporting ATPase subunit gamma
MANLKEIKKRIQSINSTMKITAAMKMVSAAKLKRAQDAIEQLKPYAQKLKEIISNVSSVMLNADEDTLAHQRPLKNILFIAITSNRGLCGAFNNNVIKEVMKLKALYPKAQVKVLPFGKKAFDILSKRAVLAGNPFQAERYNIFDDFRFNKSKAISALVIDEFLKGNIDAVFVSYNHFKNVMAQIVQTEQFLPLMSAKLAENQPINSVHDYIFEPSKPQIISGLIPKSLHVQLYKMFLDSIAAEHAARMTAMHKATDNAKGLQKDLKVAYNKARQAGITQEISEIVSGAEALK